MNSTQKDIKTKNAVRCSICKSPADLLNSGVYQCQSNSRHLGDAYVGIFTDMSFNEGDSK